MNSFLHADIDECARGIHGCHHNCRNVPGSYFCSCQKGFRLSDDLNKCVGKSVGQTCILLSILFIYYLPRKDAFEFMFSCLLTEDPMGGRKHASFAIN